MTFWLKVFFFHFKFSSCFAYFLVFLANIYRSDLMAIISKMWKMTGSENGDKPENISNASIICSQLTFKQMKMKTVARLAVFKCNDETHRLLDENIFTTKSSNTIHFSTLS